MKYDSIKHLVVPNNVATTITNRPWRLPTSLRHQATFKKLSDVVPYFLARSIDVIGITEQCVLLKSCAGEAQLTRCHPFVTGGGRRKTKVLHGTTRSRLFRVIGAIHEFLVLPCC